jgi:hypothetical protein
MSLVTPFSHPTFLGASLTGLGSQIGWNEQQSQLTVRLVEDPANGDFFNPPPTGTPIYFQLGGYNFFGFLQRWVKRNAPDGLPIFEAICNDPRSLLEGAHVVVRDYAGATSAVANLFNAYGFWENQLGFGGAQVNEAGMPWFLVLQAIEAMANTPGGTPYGGPLTFRGFSYSLDLSELPVPPPYYRLGSSDNLLTMISQLCQDGGCDFFVELEGFTIVVRTVSRYAQPPLGTITAIANDFLGESLMTSESGLESRNEITSSFLVGGERADMFLADDSAISSFWGFDRLGFPITGTPGQTLWRPVWNPPKVDVNNPPEAPPGFVNPAVFVPVTPILPSAVFSVSPPDNQVVAGGYWNFQSQDPNKASGQRYVYGSISWNPVISGVETMTLNATEVAYILGDTVYQCSTLEMRCALTNQETWEGYIESNRPDVNAILGTVTAPIANQQEIGATLQKKGDLVNDTTQYAKFLDQFVVTDDPMVRQTALWQFVRKIAEQFLGRTFLVSIPFVAMKQLPETLQIVFSQQPSDAAFLPEGSEPLGLADYNEDFFLTEDGRLKGFAFFDTTQPVDLMRLQPSDAALQPNGVYLKAEVQSQVYLNPLPCVVVELPSPVYKLSVDYVGDHSELAAVFQVDPNQLKGVMQDITSGNVNLLIAPDVYHPTNLAVPLKSNIMSYGPWYVSGPPGKVQFEYDTGMVPWAFGGFDEMNSAGMARVVNAVTFMQEAETGRIEVPGTPNWSLGDVMQAGGPNITNINVSYGANGVTTQIDMQTFSTPFGVFSKQNADRIKRLGQTGMQARRRLRQLGRNLWMFNMTGAIATAGSAFNQTLMGTLKVARPQTPHSALAMRVFSDANANNGTMLVTGSTMTDEEMVRAARANTPEIFQHTALMSLPGLLRPFSTSPSASGMSHYQEPSGVNGYTFPNALTSQTHNPFGQGHDIEWLSWGEDYEGLNTYRNTPNVENTRAIALRSPLVLSGWGWGIDGFAYPGGSGLDGQYIPHVLKRSDQWKTGVLDVLWDDYRGVWTVHDALTVVIPSGTTLPGMVKVFDPVADQDTGMRLEANNWFNGSIDTSGGDLKAILNYIPTSNSWFVVAVDCPT